MKSLGLQNVKAFRDTKDIELAPITLFVGKNSCGKSSLIRFPVVMSQTFKSSSDTPICLHAPLTSFIDYGNFEDVVHQGGPVNDSFSVRLEYGINVKDFDPDSQKRMSLTTIYKKGLKHENRAQISITYSVISKSRLFATDIQLYIDGTLFSSFELKDKPHSTDDQDITEYIFRQWKTVKNGGLIDTPEYEYNVKTREI